MPDDFTRQWGTPGSQWVKHVGKSSLNNTQEFHKISCEQDCMDVQTG